MFQAVIYYLLAVPLGAIFMVLWGIVFALNKLVFIWFVQPFVKLWFVWVRIAGVIYGAMVRTTCDPCVESFSLMWRNVRAHITVTDSAAHCLRDAIVTSSTIVGKTSFEENENTYSR